MLKPFSPFVSRQSQNPLLSGPSTSAIFPDEQCSVLPIGRHCPLKNVSSGDSQKRSLFNCIKTFCLDSVIGNIEKKIPRTWQ
jgi:hypothetical protein